MEARTLLPADGRAYAALRQLQAKEGVPRSRRRELDIELERLARDPEAVIRNYLATGTMLWGADDGGSLVGTLAVSRRRSLRAGPYLWLWGLFVRSPYRGTPASRVLMNAALAWSGAQPEGLRLFGAVTEDNLQARRFCDRHGFVRTVATARTLNLWSSAMHQPEGHAAKNRSG